MKTKPCGVTRLVLSVLDRSDGWVTTACIAPQCMIRPELVHRKARLRNETLASAISTIIAGACNSLGKWGFVEVRKTQRNRNEYKITDKGKRHLEALKEQEAKNRNAT